MKSAKVKLFFVFGEKMPDTFSIVIHHPKYMKNPYPASNLNYMNGTKVKLLFESPKKMPNTSQRRLLYPESNEDV